MKLILLPGKRCEYLNCHYCTRDWWRWYKSRMAQMATPTEDKLLPRRVAPDGTVREPFLKEGCSVPFADAAATSVRPPRD